MLLVLPYNTYSMESLNSKLKIHYLLLFLLAFGLRLYLIDQQSLWADEGGTIALASRSLEQIVRDTMVDVHPPLYYWLLHAWMLLFGQSVLAVRALSALCGALSVPLTMLLGRRYFGPSTGSIAGIVAALSPFAIYYSQETRMYALAMLLTCLLWLAVQHWLAQPTFMRLLLYLVSAAALLMTHYFAVTLVIAANVFVFVSILHKASFPSRPPGIRASTLIRPYQIYWLLAHIGLAALYLGLVWASRTRLTTWTDTKQALSPFLILSDALRHFSLGPDVELNLNTWLWSALFLLLILIGLLKRGPWQAMLMLSIWLFIPLALMIILSLNQPYYKARFLLPILPAFHMLLARGLVQATGALLTRGQGSGEWESGGAHRCRFFPWSSPPSPHPRSRTREQGDLPHQDAIPPRSRSRERGTGGEGKQRIPTRSTKKFTPERSGGGGTADQQTQDSRHETADHSPLAATQSSKFKIQNSKGQSPFIIQYSTLLALLFLVLAAWQPLSNMWFNPHFWRDDYRAAAQLITATASADAALILNGQSQIDTLNVYEHSSRPRFLLPRMRPLDPVSTTAELAQIAASHPRIYVLFYVLEESDPQGLIAGWLDSHAYRASSHWFGALQLIVWETAAIDSPAQTLNSSFQAGPTLHTVQLSAQELQPGDGLRLQLSWQASPATPHNVFIHLVRGDDTILAQYDGPLTQTTRAAILLPRDIQPGSYSLHLGLYDPANGQRLMLSAGEGDSLVLASISVK